MHKRAPTFGAQIWDKKVRLIHGWNGTQMTKTNRSCCGRSAVSLRCDAAVATLRLARLTASSTQKDIVSLRVEVDGVPRARPEVEHSLALEVEQRRFRRHDCSGVKVTFQGKRYRSKVTHISNHTSTSCGGSQGQRPPPHHARSLLLHPQRKGVLHRAPDQQGCTQVCSQDRPDSRPRP